MSVLVWQNRLGPSLARITDGESLHAETSWMNPRTLERAHGKVSVNDITAWNLSAVWCANRVLSGGVSILPLKVYKRDKDVLNGRRELHDLPAAKLAWNPNSEMTAITYWELITTLIVMRGNAYAEIEFNSYKEPVALWPLMPGTCKAGRDGRKKLVYLCIGKNGDEIVVQADRIFHVPGMGGDGITGWSVIENARRSLEVNAGYEQAANSLIENGMRPSGALKYPGSMQDIQKEEKAAKVAAKHGGVMNWNKMLLLYGGMDWVPFGMNADDAQFLETRMFQIEEVARWFGVPPHKLYDLRRSTNNNIEHQGMEFVTSSLMYWLTKIAQEYDRKVVAMPGGDVYSEHLMDAMLRGDTKTRYDAYGKAINWGFMSPNDARRKENMSPAEGGDQFFIPVNMRPIDAPWQAPKNTAPSQGGTK